ncbi:Os09g0316400, partial [Oryza sativa Japonica Group]
FFSYYLIHCIHVVLHISQQFLNKTNGQTCLKKSTALNI